MTAIAPHDEQLTRALDVLQRSEGGVVTLVDLRCGGVAHPAQAIYELEAIGVEIDRVRAPGRRRTRAGYRLAGP